MKLEKEVNIYEINHWTNISKNFGVDLTIGIKDLLNEKEMDILNTIIEKNKIKLTLEVEEPILDEEERKYLSGVIRPFRDRIKFIKKSSFSTGREYIHIETKDNYMMTMFPFEPNTMYKNMELNKEYTLEDLQL